MVTPLDKQNSEQGRELKRIQQQQRIQNQKDLEAQKAKEEATKKQQIQDLKDIDARRQNKPTDSEIAQQYKEGAPMSGVSSNSGLMGGEGTKSQAEKESGQKRSLDQKRKQQYEGASPQVQKIMKNKGLAPEDETQKTPEQQQQEPGASEPQRQSGTGGGNQKTSKHERTQQAIKKQEEELEKTRAKKKEAGKKTLEAKSEGRHFKRALNYAKYKSSQKKIRQGQKRLAALNKISEIQGITSALLRQSWYNLIDSWGLTIFYISFHFIMAYFTPLSNLFCEFGEEWRIVKIAKKTSEQSAKMMSKPLELVESSCCIGICGFLMLFFGISFVLMAVFAHIWFSPIESVWLALKMFWSAIRYKMGLGIGGS